MLFLATMLQARAYEVRNILTNSVSLEQLREALVMNQQWIPYPKTYADRTGWDALFGDFKEEVIRNGEKYLNYNWQIIKASWYLEFDRSGNRVVMEKPYMENCTAMACLLTAELAEGKGRFLSDIIDGTVFFCEMTAWPLSAHLSGLSKTKTAMPDETDYVIELFEGDLAQRLAWVWYYLHDEFDKVSPVIARRLRNELQKRELDPYLQRDDFWWMGLRQQVVNNWNTWCNSNAIMCFMLLENDRDVLARAVYKTLRSVDGYFNSVQPDGACEEGPHYWSGANGMLFDYLSSLHLLTAGKVSFFSLPLVRNMGEYIVRTCIGNGYVVNFADAGAKGGTNALMAYRFGKAVGSPLMMGYAADKVGREGGIRLSYDHFTSNFRLFECLRIARELSQYSPKFQQPPCTWYPATQFCYLSNDEGLFLGAKGGHNAESHNHNDVGTCVFYIDAQPVLVDAGKVVYTRQTFSDERYTLWPMQSAFHNLPTINGCMQRDGHSYAATKVKADEKRLTFSLDIAAAYPAEAKVRTWNRSYRLRGNTLHITDKFELSEAMEPNEVNFLAKGKPRLLADGRLLIAVEGIEALLKYNPKQFVVAIDELPLTDADLRNSWGDRLYHIVFKAIDTPLTGTYDFEITKTP
ncbi:MAG: heparinase II/III family protein [Bacteroidales bacterium]|nr:heparinase II/III family protein [Bacteroidales bacterium]